MGSSAIDNSILPLYYLCSVAGFVMVIGGIWLIYKQKIYIDRESKQVTEIDTPIGKFKTNLPALVLFALGFVPLIYPIVAIKEIRKEVRIVGNVKSSIHPVHVYAVTQTDSLLQDRDFRLTVPSPSSEGYKIIYVAGGIVLEDLANPSSDNGKEIKLSAKEIVAVSYESNVLPTPKDF
jgi:hypothetical protein